MRVACSLLADLSRRDLSFLCNWDTMYRKVAYVSDFTCFEPDHDSVPWFVALSLATTGRKFRIQCKAGPKFSQFVDDITNLQNKIKWAWEHRNSPSVDSSVISKLKRQRTPHFRRQPDPLVADLCRALRSNLVRAFNSGLKSIAGSRAELSNSKLIFDFTLQWIKDNNMVVVQTDKCGKMAVLKRNEFESMCHAKIDPDTYTPVAFQDVSMSGIHKEMSKICSF